MSNSLYFVTGSAGKFDEARRVIPYLEQKDLDLIEIQHTDATEIIRPKLIEARKHHEGPVVVEDTGLHLECLNGLPGPLIKWFLKDNGAANLAEIAARHGNDRCYARTVVGYSHGSDIKYFEGVVHGRIVLPCGEFGFGWDRIFLPDGYTRTFGEMGRDEKNTISMRGKAFMQLRDYLESTHVINR